MAHLTVQLLGSFEAHLASGSSVNFATKKTLALLAYLALYPGKRHSRLKLATLLWARSDEAHARVNLRQTIKLLRQSLLHSECACVITDSDAVHLDPTHVETDAATFDQCCKQSTPDALEHAAELYRGELLEDFELQEESFEHWLTVERRNFHDRAIDALRRLQAHHLNTDNTEHAIRIGVRLLSLDPLQEDIHRTLMELYANSGDRRLAINQYQMCRDILKSDLGLEPDAATERLHQQIRSQSWKSRVRRKTGQPERYDDLLSALDIDTKRHLGLSSLGEDLPLPETPSIAILPFKNLSGDPGQDYFSEGFRLDIQAALIRISKLLLIAPGTTNAYRNTEIDAVKAGREMGVQFVLEGGARKQDQRVFFTLQLTNTINQEIIWAEQNEGSQDDMRVVRDEVLASILEAMHIELHAGEEARIFQNTLVNFEARECFYRGVNLGYAMTKDGNAAAREMFKNVIRLQPDSPVGPTYLSYTYWLDVFRGWTDQRERSLQQAISWAEKALNYAGTNGLANIVLAYDHLMKNHHENALAAGYEAIEFRPNCPVANGFMANVLVHSGHPKKALLFVKKAIRRSPIYPPWFVNVLALAYRDSGQIDSSIVAARRSIEINPRDVDARAILCSNYMLLEQRPLAVEAAREIVEINPKFSIAKYAEDRPYKDKETLRRLVGHLRGAGLSE